MTYEFLKSLYSDILMMVSKLVVKRMDQAREYETAETIINFERYYACLIGTQNFYDFGQFDLDLLEKYLSVEEAQQCYYDINKIPMDLRPLLIRDQSKRVIESYVEKNDYYRMLAGLPSVNDHYWIYVSDYHDIPNDVPIHEMTIEQISHLEVRGKIDELKKEHPEALYLDYLGDNSIDIVTARKAKPFEILRLGTPANARSQEMFESEYYMARRYVMATMYNRDLFTNKTLYDPIMGILMLCLAIRNTLVPSEADYLNFEEILDAILESYGMLRYFEKFPFIFKRRLVLAMDKILAVKGTDGVLVDVCRIFSMENFNANRYFLVKTQPKDIDGHTIFSDDPEKAYKLEFVKTDIQSHEISMAEENRIAYETVVNNDYLWQLTEEEKRQIMSEDFNIMMTKYIGIEAAYDLSELTFEVCHFINLLLQSREEMAKIRCTNMYATGGSSNVYTMIVFLLAGLAKRSGFDGNIVYETDQIAEVLRFNYADISEELQAIIDKYELAIDVTDHLVPGYDRISLAKPVGNMTDYQMVDVYLSNRALYYAICEEMRTTTDYRRYIALSNARDCMYISYMEREDFVKVDGTSAQTYYEMLQDVDPKLARKLDTLDRVADANDLDKLLLYILDKLEELFSSEELKYLFLNTPNTYGTLISKYLRMAINVFKASSVQLESINVFFNIGDGMPVRVLEHRENHKTFYINEPVHVEDEISTHKTIVVEEIVGVMDKPYVNE